MRPVRILIVDGHRDTCEVLSKLLKRDRYAVDCAYTYADAVAAAAAARPNLLVTELGLPGGTGDGLLRELRELYGVRGIAMTSDDGRGYGAACRDAGFRAVLIKPVTWAVLSAAIRSAAEAAAVAPDAP